MLLCASFITSTSAIYADEAGVRDWSVANYGHVSDAILTDSIVYIGSTSGVTAALDAKNGSMLWRNVAGTKKSYLESSTIDHHHQSSSRDTSATTTTTATVGIKSILLSPNGLRMFSVSGNILRCVNTKSGRVIWDAPITLTNVKATIVYNDDDNTVIYQDNDHRKNQH